MHYNIIMNVNLINSHQNNDIYNFLQKTKYKIYDKNHIKNKISNNILNIDYLIISSKCIYVFQDKWYNYRLLNDKINNFINDINILYDISKMSIYVIYLSKNKLSFVNQKEINKINNPMIKFITIYNNNILLLLNKLMEVLYTLEYPLFIYDNDDSIIMCNN